MAENLIKMTYKQKCSICKKVLWEREGYPNSENPNYYIWTFKERVRAYDNERIQSGNYYCEKCLMKNFGLTKKEIYAKRFVLRCNTCRKKIEMYRNMIKKKGVIINISIGMSKQQYVDITKGGNYCSKSCAVLDEV